MGTSSISFELVCIGSSPLCLLEALDCAKRGGRALVVDAADRIGGAWRECQVFGLRRAEIAPHIVLFNRATYDFLAEELGVRMRRMTPPPRYVLQTRFGPWWIPYVLSPFIAYVTVPLHYVRNPQFRTNFALIREEYFGRLGDAARQLAQWAFSRRKPHIEYPAGGTLELLDRLGEKLAEHGVEVRTGVRVESVERDAAGGVEVKWAGGCASARRVCMTRHQRVERFAVEGRRIDAEYQPFAYDSVHLLVRMETPLRAAFILAKRDPLVNLVSDLTSYMADVPAGRRVLVLRLHGWDGPRDAAGGARVFEHLQRHGYVPAGAALEAAEFSSYEQGRMTPEGIERIERGLGGSVRVFRSTNFSNSIGAETARWRGRGGG